MYVFACVCLFVCVVCGYVHVWMRTCVGAYCYSMYVFRAYMKVSLIDMARVALDQCAKYADQSKGRSHSMCLMGAVTAPFLFQYLK